MNNAPAEKNRRILIIDDNRAIHDDFRKILCPASVTQAAMEATEAELFDTLAEVAQTRFEVDSAYQGTEGLARVQQALAAGKPYAMAFVDVRMPPGMDGVETTRKIWELDPGLQIVLCTAYSDYSWSEMFALLGYRDSLLILKKPFDTVEAFQLAHALTEKWWLQRQSMCKMEELEQRVVERTAELQKQQAELRVLFDLMPAMIWFKDTRNGFLKVNQRVAEATGLSIAEIEGKTAEEIFPKEAAGYYADDLEVIHSKAPKMGIVEKLQGPEGQKFWIKTDKMPVCDKDGNVIGLIAMVHNITENMRTEEMLRLLSSAVKQSKESIMITEAELDMPGPKIIFVNPAFTQMTGYTAADVIGKTPRLLQGPHTDRTVLNRLRQNLALGEMFKGEAINYRKDGTEFDLEWQITPLRNASGVISHFVAVQRDITGRKRLEAQLLQSHKLETVGKLAGGVAHEFNSILTAIIGQSELLNANLPTGSTLAKSADEISKAAGRAAKLTRQLLAYGRKQLLQPEALDLNRVIMSMADMFHHLMGGEVKTQIISAPDLHAVQADAGQMEQVIMNMIINARDAMPGGGKLTLETKNVTLDHLYVSQFPESELAVGDYVMLAITDNGTGMSADVKARVFEPFFTTKGVGEGTGLGLSSCYGIIKQSGGHISVFSELNHGTTFNIYLPQTTQPPASSSSPRPAPLDLPHGTETILLVEDDPDMREMVTSLLRRLGYTVLGAANGIEALRLSQERGTAPIDLLFTDFVMPDMNGKELADHLQALGASTRILFTTDYTANPIVRQGVLNQDLAVLQKPFTPSALAHKLRCLLDQPNAVQSYPAIQLDRV